MVAGRSVNDGRRQRNYWPAAAEEWFAEGRTSRSRTLPVAQGTVMSPYVTISIVPIERFTLGALLATHFLPATGSRFPPTTVSEVKRPTGKHSASIAEVRRQEDPAASRHES